MTGRRGRSGGVGREVQVVAPGGPVFRFRLGDDDTAVVLLDGQPVVGLDAGGPGRWRDGQVWERFGGGTVTDRYVVVPDMSAEQFAGLAPHLSLPAGWFGRFKGGPGELRAISLTGGEWSCGSDAGLDLALEYVRGLGLGYEETRTVRFDPPSGDHTAGGGGPEVGPAGAAVRQRRRHRPAAARHLAAGGRAGS